MVTESYIVNLTAAQYDSITQPKPLIDQIIGNPFFWVVVALILVLIIVYRFTAKPKADVSTKPFYGREVRSDVMKKEYGKRFNTLATRSIKKGVLMRGITTTMGKPIAIDYDKVTTNKYEIDRATRKKKWVADKVYRVDRIKFRKYGFLAWLKALFGAGFEYVMLTPDVYTTQVSYDKKKYLIVINPNAQLINDSGIWTLADNVTLDANRQMVMKAEHENLHGSEMDNLRRQAVHNVGVQATLEKASHEQELKEKDRKARSQPYM